MTRTYDNVKNIGVAQWQEHSLSPMRPGFHSRPGKYVSWVNAVPLRPRGFSSASPVSSPTKTAIIAPTSE